MKYTMTEQEFANKIEWEGGILDALDYGLTPEDVEGGELQDAWRTLYIRYTASLKPAVERVQELLWGLEESE